MFWLRLTRSLAAVFLLTAFVSAVRDVTRLVLEFELAFMVDRLIAVLALLRLFTVARLLTACVEALWLMPSWRER
jgi:hypothetical protein